MKFTVEKNNYFNRLKKEYLFYFLLLSTVVFYFHHNNPGRIDWPVIIGIMLVLAFIFSLLAHKIAKTNFHEVELNEDHITLRGHEINKPIEIKLPIKNTDAQFKSIGQGRGKIEYFLRITNDTEVYDINKLLNWNYNSLINLFNSIKDLKKEPKSRDDKLIR